MMKQSELEQEITDRIEAVLDGPGSGAASIITQQTVAAHHLDRDVLDFDVLCAFEHVRTTVRKVLRRYEPSGAEEQDPQLVMDGFKRVQRGYLVERDGEQRIVKTTLLTAREIRRKAAEYRRCGVGCFEHADELDRLADSRDQAQPSA